MCCSKCVLQNTPNLSAAVTLRVSSDNATGAERPVGPANTVRSALELCCAVLTCRFERSVSERNGDARVRGLRQQSRAPLHQLASVRAPSAFCLISGLWALYDWHWQLSAAGRGAARSLLPRLSISFIS